MSDNYPVDRQMERMQAEIDELRGMVGKLFEKIDSQRNWLESIGQDVCAQADRLAALESPQGTGEPEPVCGNCGHPMSKHDESGRCHGVMMRVGIGFECSCSLFEHGDSVNDDPDHEWVEMEECPTCRGTGLIVTPAQPAPAGGGGKAWARVRHLLAPFEDGDREPTSIALDAVASAIVDALLTPEAS